MGTIICFPIPSVHKIDNPDLSTNDNNLDHPPFEWYAVNLPTLKTQSYKYFEIIMT